MAFLTSRTDAEWSAPAKFQDFAVPCNICNTEVRAGNWYTFGTYGDRVYRHGVVLTLCKDCRDAVAVRYNATLESQPARR